MVRWVFLEMNLKKQKASFSPVDHIRDCSDNEYNGNGGAFGDGGILRQLPGGAVALPLPTT